MVELTILGGSRETAFFSKFELRGTNASAPAATVTGLIPPQSRAGVVGRLNSNPRNQFSLIKSKSRRAQSQARRIRWQFASFLTLSLVTCYPKNATPMMQGCCGTAQIAVRYPLTNILKTTNVDIQPCSSIECIMELSQGGAGQSGQAPNTGRPMSDVCGCWRGQQHWLRVWGGWPACFATRPK